MVTMKPIKILLFAVIQIVLLPVLIVGVAMVVTRQFFGNKQQGLSATAVHVLLSRWSQHYVGDRKDPVSVEMAKHLPNVSHAGMSLYMSATILSRRLFGYVPGVFSVAPEGRENIMNFIYTRHLFFDDVFKKNIGNMDQVVLMGAGFDSRPYLYCKRDGLAVFELDQPNTQQIKREVIERAGIDAAFIRFVPVDFNREDWCQELLAAEFEPSKKTLFLWEGVTPYLEESEVNQALQLMSKISAPGSVIALDLYSWSFVSLIRKRAGGMYKSMSGETFHSGLDFSEDAVNSVERFLESEDLKPGRIQLCGHKRPGKEPICALVEAHKG